MKTVCAGAVALALLFVTAQPASADDDVSACKDAYCVVVNKHPKPKPKAPVVAPANPILHTTDPLVTDQAPALCGVVGAGTGDPACVAPPPAPVVTAADAAHAFEEVPLPHLASQSQPTAKTLVNFDTIFYVEAQPLQRVVTLLGQQVTLDIKPARYLWTYGDGAQQSTSTPGAKYPAKEIVHRYPKAHRDVVHTVTITWTARFRVNGGAWADVPGTVTTAGPPTTLHVSEATPVLTGRR